VGNDQRDMWRAAGILSTVGMVMALSVFAGFLGGYGLDHWLHTGYVFSIIGLVLGVIAGFREAIRMIRRFARNF